MGRFWLRCFLFFIVVFEASVANSNQKGDDADCRGPKGEKVGTVTSKDTSAL